MIATVASQQVVSLSRQRIFLALLGTFLAMTALAGVIGWSSHNTIVRVYNDAVQVLSAAGQPAPPSPFGLKPTLSLLSNMAIYIPLVGALLALVLGHLSLADDQSGGIGRLIFSRQLSRTSYVMGKLVSAAAVLGAVIVASMAVSVVSLLLVNRSSPSVAEFGRLGLFYGLSWLYLMLFALIGMVAVLVTRRRSVALLAAMGVWLVLTFAVPQFTSGLHPTASLNPVNDPVSTSQPFFDATAKVRPVSVTEQYKEAGARILGTAPSESAPETALRVLPLAVSVAGLGLLTTRLVRRHDYSKGSYDE
ncbi:MAG: ABC transporter permease subunit [Acidimicrobiales bacterium]|nr:ABC transporter permease subunit [Acidimicrobiales bacterium]